MQKPDRLTRNPHNFFLYPINFRVTQNSNRLFIGISGLNLSILHSRILLEERI